MKMTTMALGAYQTNCYLAWSEESDECIIVDPGYEPERVLAQTQKYGHHRPHLCPLS